MASEIVEKCKGTHKQLLEQQLDIVCMARDRSMFHGDGQSLPVHVDFEQNVSTSYQSIKEIKHLSYNHRSPENI